MDLGGTRRIWEEQEEYERNRSNVRGSGGIRRNVRGTGGM